MKMMNNLFSMFDPSSSIMNLNWILILFPIIILKKTMKKTSKKTFFLKMFSLKLKTEMKTLMEKSKKNNSILMMISIFMWMMILNLTSLFPFNFTITSQVSITLPLSIIFWMSFLIIGWTKKPKNMLSHLLPMGTPIILMPMMIIIEIMSQIIRPITLSIRMTANMVAGHLLLSLLSSLLMTKKMLIMTLFPTMILLTFLEICVSIIQAFVFTTLLTLYSTEIN